MLLYQVQQLFVYCVIITTKKLCVYCVIKSRTIIYGLCYYINNSDWSTVLLYQEQFINNCFIIPRTILYVHCTVLYSVHYILWYVLNQEQFICTVLYCIIYSWIFSEGYEARGPYILCGLSWVGIIVCKIIQYFTVLSPLALFSVREPTVG